MRFLSPAKINLFLHLLNKRKDDYYNLISLFKLLNWGDYLSFKSSNKLEVICSNIKQEKNLVYITIKKLAQRYSCNINFEINIEKNIPIGSGLGGSSTNAALALIKINEINNLGLQQDELIDFGADIGADLPFFIKSYFNQETEYFLVSGKGENLKPVEITAKLKFLLIMPNISCNTTKMFSLVGSTNSNQHLTKLINLSKNKRYQQTKIDLSLIQKSANDFQSIAIKNYPEISEIFNIINNLPKDCKNWLIPPRLSGSGSSIYISFDNYQNLEETKKLLAKKINSGKIVAVH